MRHGYSSIHISSNSPPASVKGERGRPPGGTSRSASTQAATSTTTTGRLETRTSAPGDQTAHTLTETDNHFYCESCHAAVSRERLNSWLQRGRCPATLDTRVPQFGRGAFHESHTLTFLDDPRTRICTACGHVARLRALKLGQPCSHILSKADAMWSPSRTAENWTDTGIGLTRYRPQEPSTRRTGGLVVSRYAALAVVFKFLLQFFQARTTCGCCCSSLATTTRWDPSSATMRPVRKPPALCFVPLRTSGSWWHPSRMKASTLPRKAHHLPHTGRSPPAHTARRGRFLFSCGSQILSLAHDIVIMYA